MTKRIHQMTVKEWDRAFPTEAACAEYLVRHRWPLGVICPRCGNPKVYELGKEFHWQCQQCAPQGYRFSHIAGTLFENTNKPLRDWFRVLHMMVTSKKGVAALQVQRVMGFGSYKTAWYMCMRLRTALQDKDFQAMMGIVEIDETFVGGKAINKHGGRKGPKDPKGPTGGKTAVVGAVQRSKKTVVARVIGQANFKTVSAFVRATIDSKVSVLATDQARYFEAHDCPVADRVVRRIKPAKKLLGDKAYDSAELRQWLEDRGTKAIIPNRSNRKQPLQLRQEVVQTTSPHRERLLPAQRLQANCHALRSRLARNFLASVCLVAARSSGGFYESGP